MRSFNDEVVYHPQVAKAKLAREAEEYLQDVECFAEAQEIANGYLREEPIRDSLMKKFQDIFDI